MLNNNKQLQDNFLSFFRVYNRTLILKNPCRIPAFFPGIFPGRYYLICREEGEKGTNSLLLVICNQDKNLNTYKKKNLVNPPPNKCTAVLY